MPGSFEDKNALAVMLKYPALGRVKTRLVPPLTPEQASGLYSCFIKDFFPRAASLECADVFAAYASEGEGDCKAKIAGMLGARGIACLAGSASPPPGPHGRGAGLVEQEREGLGPRINNLFKRLFERGYNKVVVVGSDSPDLPLEYIVEAFGLLDETTGLVLGPALDGGYYLVGLKVLFPALFEDIAWSTTAVLAQTIERARGSSIGYRLLKPWHDIDTPEDLRFLRDNPMTPESSAFIAGLSTP